MNYFKIAILLLTLALPETFSQVHRHDGHDHEHEHNHHGRYEIAIGGGAAYIPSDAELFPALHLHLGRSITEKIGLGVGYEGIFGDHTHHAFLAMITLDPFRWIHLSTGPGIVLPHEEHDELKFKWGAELAVPFSIGRNLHIGPMLDYGWTTEESHVFMGIHLGIHL
jgi:hypothetical protein